MSTEGNPSAFVNRKVSQIATVNQKRRKRGAYIPKKAGALKGHDFSRANKVIQGKWALQAAEKLVQAQVKGAL